MDLFHFRHIFKTIIPSYNMVTCQHGKNKAVIYICHAIQYTVYRISSYQQGEENLMLPLTSFSQNKGNPQETREWVAKHRK